MCRAGCFSQNLLEKTIMSSTAKPKSASLSDVCINMMPPYGNIEYPDLFIGFVVSRMHFRPSLIVSGHRWLMEWGRNALQWRKLCFSLFDISLLTEHGVWEWLCLGSWESGKSSGQHPCWTPLRDGAFPEVICLGCVCVCTRVHVSWKANSLGVTAVYAVLLR